MLTSRPTTPPDVYGTVTNITDSGKGTIEIFYKIRNGEIKSWVQPTNSTLNEHNFPDWLDINAEFAAWSENISKTRKKDFDWIWIEPLTGKLNREIDQSPMTPLTRQIKKKQAIHQLNDLKSTFDKLFELAKENLDDQ